MLGWDGMDGTLCKYRFYENRSAVLKIGTLGARTKLLYAIKKMDL